MIDITLGCNVTMTVDSEYCLIGNIFAYIALSEIKDDLPEFDIVTSDPFLVLPVNLISVKDSMTFLKKLYDDFQTNSPDGVEVMPLTEKMQTKTFSIPNEHIKEFITGYYAMPDMLTAFYEIANEKQIRDHFPPSIVFIEKAILVGTPTEPDNEGFKFILDVPNYTWIIQPNVLFVEQMVSNLVALFLRDCTESDHHLLNDKHHYLRFMLYQDSEKGNPYVRGYLRNIDNCRYTSHQNHLRSCPAGTLPLEINYSSRGYFLRIVQTEWNNKNVSTILEF